MWFFSFFKLIVTSASGIIPTDFTLSIIALSETFISSKTGAEGISCQLAAVVSCCIQHSLLFFSTFNSQPFT